jgi:glycosyltransferase involved in cell wall biosynthesis
MSPSIAAVSWESNSNEFLSGLKDGQIHTTGGNYYNIEAAKILQSQYNFSLDERFVRKPGETILHYYFRVKSYRSSGKITIKDPYVISFGNASRSSVNIGMIHHLDFIKKWTSFKNLLYFTKLEHNLTKLDHVVTVSEFWQDYVRKLGCAKTSVIYNSFNLNEFEFNAQEVERFKKKYEINDKRPLVYLGVSESGKGYDLAASRIKNHDYLLVTTGVGQISDSNITSLGFLPRREYLILLHLSKAVITYSSIPEGWNRVAHESLLCRTPVIGSGSGGMGELLQNSGQKIVEDPDAIPMAVEEVLSERDNLAAAGYAYVKNYDLEYFKRSWINLINNYLNI